MELNEYGMRVWKHKTNKRLFLQQSYSWVDRLTLIDETEGRQIIMDFKVSTFDFYAWTPMSKEEYDSVKSVYKEIYKQSGGGMVDAYPKYVQMVELNYMDIPLAGSNPVLTTKK